MKKVGAMTKKISERIYAENPEWTAEKFARSMRFSDLPESLQAKLSSRKRGPQVAPKKVPVSIRLSKDVADDLRAMGDGWQTRADEALRSWIKRQPKTAKAAG